MIHNVQELEATKERIRYFQHQVERLRQVEINPQNYRLSAGGYLAEIDRMNLEVGSISPFIQVNSKNRPLESSCGKPLKI